MRTNQEILDDLQILTGGREIVLAVRHGSRLYGTAGPDSDDDIRAVFLPSREDILMGDVDRTISSNKSHASLGAGDTDIVAHSFLRFMNLLGHFDFTAIEMLFGSMTAHARIRSSALMDDLAARSSEVIGVGDTTILGHIRANLKGLAPQQSRYLKTMSLVFDALEPCDGTLRIPEVPGLLATLAAIDGVHLVLHTPNGEKTGGDIPRDVLETGRCRDSTLFIVVGGKRIAANSRISIAMAPLARGAADYRAAARTVDPGEKIDLKDAYHAFRMLDQLVEIASSGTLVFPRRNAAFLCAVRNDAISTPELRSMAEDLFDQAERALIAGPPFGRSVDPLITRKWVFAAHMSRFAAAVAA